MKKVYLTHISFSIFVLLILAFFVSSAAAYDTYSAGCAGCHGSFTSGTYSSLAAAKAANPAWPGTLHDVHRNSSIQTTPGMLNGNCNACHFGASRTPVYTNQSNGTAPFNLSCSGCHDGPGLRAHHVNSGADTTCYDCHIGDPTPDPENVLRPVYTATFGTTSGTTRVNDPCNLTAAGFEGRLGDVGTIGLDNDGNLLYDQDDPACKPAVAVLSVSPTTLAFSNQTTGTTSATKTVTISNTGTASLSVSGITNSNTTDFVVTSQAMSFSVAAGASQTFTVAFKPATTGAKTATISIASNGGSASVSATGTGVAPVMGVSPTTLTFGNQTTGTTSAAQTVTISNTGTATLNVTSVSSSSAEFKFSPTTVSPIAAGGTAALSVTFAPVTAGAKSAAINITSDGGSASVSATGTGSQPTIAVPNVVGMTQAAATTAITGVGLTVGTVTTQSSSTVAAGNVISQNPTAGSSVASGSSVSLVVSSGLTVVGGSDDVALVNLTLPEQVTAHIGRSSEVKIHAYATTTARETLATVTLTADPSASVSVSVDHASDTEEIKASEDKPESFEFAARIVCTQRGTWPITWTAKISSAQNSDPANDALTSTTQVVCTGKGERRGSLD